MLKDRVARLADAIGDFLVQRSRSASWLLLLAVAASLGGAALFLPEHRLVAVFHDDSFYYFGVARNVAAANGVSFDGIHRTNGFHPLWMATLVPVFGVFRGDTAPLRVILAIQLGLIAIAGISLFRMLLPKLGIGAATAALALVTLPGSSTILAGGLESSLVLVLLVATWHRWCRTVESEVASDSDWLMLGSFCAAALLARIEALVLVPAGLLLCHRRLRSEPRRAAAFLVPPGIAAIAFLLWNRLGFGLWLPVSGLIKAEWARRASFWRRVTGFLDLPWFGQDLFDRALSIAGIPPGSATHVTVRLLLFCAMLAIAWIFRRSLVAATRSSGLAFLLVACAGWVVLDKVSVLALEPWNRVPLHLCTAILLGALVSAHPRLATAATVLLFAMAIAKVPWTAHHLGGTGTTLAIYRHQAALWLRENTLEDTRIGSWNAGLLGYFSHRPVVSLDGLVNDRQYFESVIVGGELDGYLRREGIEWLADQACGLNPSLRPYLLRTGSEWLEPEFVVETVFSDDRAPDRCPGYTIWRRK